MHVTPLLLPPLGCPGAAEWVPVGRLRDAGLLAACGFLLNTTEFRDAACEVLRQVAARKLEAQSQQGGEPPEVLSAVLDELTAALVGAAASLLSPAAQASGRVGWACGAGRRAGRPTLDKILWALLLLVHSPHCPSHL